MLQGAILHDFGTLTFIILFIQFPHEFSEFKMGGYYFHQIYIICTEDFKDEIEYFCAVLCIVEIKNNQISCFRPKP